MPAKIVGVVVVLQTFQLEKWHRRPVLGSLTTTSIP